ncbi:hypothetical protein K456DRAFT_608810 [Colletotrichum gloeosporioides 23]|nr:hypothetical protein K456DRAFT_608810 [Colletotrichum gloeosporioides 23]
MITLTRTFKICAYISSFHSAVRRDFLSGFLTLCAFCIVITRFPVLFFSSSVSLTMLHRSICGCCCSSQPRLPPFVSMIIVKPTMRLLQLSLRLTLAHFDSSLRRTSDHLT